ncbi:MAG: FG-GAP repeat domain-containing protein, partial [Nevskiales bacterium]
EQVYTNDGSGKFSLLPQYFLTTFQPQTPTIADYNGDGKQDVIVGGTGGQMSVLINTTP